LQRWPNFLSLLPLFYLNLHRALNANTTTNIPATCFLNFLLIAMAVIDEVPQMTARVRVAGQLATEYEAPDDFEMIDDPSTEEDTTPSKHCYIECKSGAEFAIEVEVSSDFKIPRTNDTIWIQVFIDGGYMDNLAVDKHDLRNKGQVTGIMSSARCVMDTGRAMDKKFVFAPITRSLPRRMGFETFY
jgi:hypothetical protein